MFDFVIRACKSIEAAIYAARIRRYARQIVAACAADAR